MQPAGKPRENPLKGLLQFGQSVWLDYIRRDLIATGELARLIKEDGLRGMTSNPAIFEKAIAGSTDYTQALDELAKRKDLDAKGIFEQLAIRDIQDAADALRPVYDESKRRDGYVGLEVSPYLAHKTEETIEEARRLWKSVGRANLMIKVPGTPEGIPAFQQLISEGINVNVTLLFAQDVYERVAKAYIAGLEEFVKSGGDASRIASVASFFVSRIDTLADSLLADRVKNAKTPAERDLARMPSSPTRSTRRFSAMRAGRRLPAAAGRRSAFSGPAPARRIPPSATFFTSRN
jgi:transaldolase/glucose-6-phosphate isomerase